MCVLCVYLFFNLRRIQQFHYLFVSSAFSLENRCTRDFLVCIFNDSSTIVSPLLSLLLLFSSFAAYHTTNSHGIVHYYRQLGIRQNFIHFTLVFFRSFHFARNAAPFSEYPTNNGFFLPAEHSRTFYSNLDRTRTGCLF